jgi:sulfonate transport system permease protein
MRLNKGEVAVSTAALISLWSFAAMLMHSAMILPSPGYVLTTSLPAFAIFGGMAPSYAGAIHILAIHLAVTAWRATIGLLIGVAIGVTVGTVISLPRVLRGRRTLGLGVGALKNLPLFGFIPLFIFWFSNRPSSVVGYVAFATVLLVLPGAAAASARGTSPIHVDLARVAGAGPWAIFWKVLWPSTWPLLRPTLRFAVSLMWAFSLGAEYAGSPQVGLGVLAYQAYLWSDMGRMIVIALTYLLAGIASIFVFDIITVVATICNGQAQSSQRYKQRR